MENLFFSFYSINYEFLFPTNKNVDLINDLRKDSKFDYITKLRIK